MILSTPALFTPPTTTEFFSQIGTWSTQMFTSLLPLMYLILGLIVGALILRAVLRGVLNAVRTFAARDRGGARGRLR